jgi:alpha-L-fucosidase
MKKYYIIQFIILAFILLSCDDKDEPGNTVVIDNTPSKLEYEARVKWLRDAKFGVIVHFGPGILSGGEISWCRVSDRGDGSDPYHSDFGPVTHEPEEYDSLYKIYNPTKFEPDEWVDIFQRSGFKYFLFVSKHHDGFCNFETEHAYNNYKITNPSCPYGKDISLELSKASKAKGLKFGFYYSVPDWKDPDFMKTYHNNYVERMEGQIEELLSEKYSPELMFFDSRFPLEYYNGENIIEKIWENNQNIIINDRCLYKGDYETPEGEIYSFSKKKMWMSLYGLGKHWSYVENDDIQSGEKVIDNLSKVVCNDGIFTIGIGPKPDGTIAEDHAKSILDAGKWLEKYGECIYGTRGGPYANFPQVGATYKSNILYLHVRDWGNNLIILPRLNANVTDIKALNSGATFALHEEGDSMIIYKDAGTAIDGTFEVLKLTLDKEVKDLPTINWK